MNKISRIVNNRIVAIMLHGRSIEKLEKRITEYRDMNICWASMGLFTIMERYILNKISKRLEIIFDSATVPESRMSKYENKVRLPRIESFLERTDNNLWVTSHGIVRDSIRGLGRYDILDRFQEKIYEVDGLFPRRNIGQYMSVPNSATLFIASIMASNPKKIIIFGLDGYVGNATSGVYSYYKSNLAAEERLSALGSLRDDGVNRDSNSFLNRFPNLLKEYRRLFNCHAPIANCSPSSIYQCPTKINYNELRGWLMESR